MADSADIARTALRRIGVRKKLSALTDQTPEATLCADLYPEVRDQALSQYRWPWAETIKALTLSATTIPGWTYAYAYPNACLSLTGVCDAAGARGWTRPVSFRDSFPRLPPADQPYRVFHSGAVDDSSVIATDVPEAYAVYVVRVENVNEMPVLFRSAVAWLLAAELATALEVDADLAKLAMQMAPAALSEAAAASMNEALDDPELPSPSILARG